LVSSFFHQADAVDDSASSNSGRTIVDLASSAAHERTGTRIGSSF
jgi:hypothetical protein